MSNQPTSQTFDRGLIVGNSPATQQLVDLARRVAQSNAPVLLQGPAGTEFAVVAEFIHHHSDQASHPFVRQRCISWQDLVDPLNLVGSGTLLVEGIEHASLPVQMRLLHELEQAQLMQLKADGTSLQAPRIIASTTSDLPSLVAQGLFLDDLYWQLCTLAISIPALIKRAQDLEQIAQILLAQIVAIHRPPLAPVLTKSAIDQLQAYSWPGNYRELYSTLRRAVLMANGAELSFEFLANSGQGAVSSDEGHRSDVGAPPISASAPFAEALPTKDFVGLVQVVVNQGIVEADRRHKELHQFIVDNVEKSLISTILAECDNVQTKAATRLGINRNTLHKKMKDFGLDPTN